MRSYSLRWLHLGWYPQFDLAVSLQALQGQERIPVYHLALFFLLFYKFNIPGT
jgi:hypothetical protein